MVEVTHGDEMLAFAIVVHLNAPRAQEDYIAKQIATHREAAAKAVTDGLRDLPRETALAMLEAFYKDEMPDMLGMIPDMQDAATAPADTLEKQL